MDTLTRGGEGVGSQAMDDPGLSEYPGNPCGYSDKGGGWG